MRWWFFFSSRRRHTRWTGDWSSDVCSSDLGRLGESPGPPRSRLAGAPLAVPHESLSRSEERRVGKECRFRWWPEHQKKKGREAADRVDEDDHEGGDRVAIHELRVG